MNVIFFLNSAFANFPSAGLNVVPYPSIQELGLSIEEFRSVEGMSQVLDLRRNAEDGLLWNSRWIPLVKVSDLFFKFDLLPPLDHPILFVVDKGDEQTVIEKFRSLGFTKILGYNSFDLENYDAPKWELTLIKATEALSIRPRTHVDVRETN
jgi:hypothetical protein